MVTNCLLFRRPKPRCATCPGSNFLSKPPRVWQQALLTNHKPEAQLGGLTVAAIEDTYAGPGIHFEKLIIPYLDNSSQFHNASGSGA